MKILVIGSGGREHAIITKLKENPLAEQIFALPGNGGIAELAQCVPIAATDVEGAVNFAVENEIDFAVVTPDDPLALGMVDELVRRGIAAFGPTKSAARIESSKLYAKKLMDKYDIPTAKYKRFDSLAPAVEYARRGAFPKVIKADGLALGKGVYIVKTPDEAEQALEELMKERRFGDSGTRVLIEEFLQGYEVSVLCFTDGNVIIPMVSAMDHKRAFDYDKGANTGGMGAVAPSPYYTEGVAKHCYDSIILPTMNALNAEGNTFKGCLYFGLMLTMDGPRVIEYNCRFGDPETQAVLPLMQSDLLDVMLAVSQGRLAQADVRFSDEHACCVVMASGGYPDRYEKGFPIKLDSPDALVFHAGTRRTREGYVTDGGRVLGVTAVRATRQEAVDAAYAAVKRISFKNAHYRTDIGMR